MPDLRPKITNRVPRIFSLYRFEHARASIITYPCTNIYTLLQTSVRRVLFRPALYLAFITSNLVPRDRPDLERLSSPMPSSPLQ